MEAINRILSQKNQFFLCHSEIKCLPLRQTKNSMYRILTIAYFLCLLLDIVGIVAPLPELRYVFKSLLMPILMALIWVQTPRPFTGVHLWLLAAIFFSWGGDVFLLNTTDIYFMLGLVSFLLGHLSYIISFTLDIRRTNNRSDIISGRPFYLLPFVVFLGGFLYLLRNIGDLFIPVVVYATVLVLMVITALRRYGRVETTSFRWVFWGALLFMVSNSLIATNRFLVPLPFADAWIMLLYCTSQYLIVVGMLPNKHYIYR